MKKITVLQIVTIISLIAYLIWEYAVWGWMKAEPTVPIRVDLVIIIPILCTLIILSAIQYFKGKK